MYGENAAAFGLDTPGSGILARVEANWTDVLGDIANISTALERGDANSTFVQPTPATWETSVQLKREDTNVRPIPFESETT